METTAQLTRFPAAAHPKMVVRAWHRFALVGILLLAAFLHFFRLEQEGYANLYYAAGVKSILTSWHNFFFVTFDPGGFVSIDKPPLGFWVQAASAALFGFNGLSLLLPQALAGVLSVLVLYHLVRRTFGPMAGLMAALVLAVTPIFVAANRNNTMDSLLVLTLLLAAWAALRAAESGRLRWLLIGAGLVGLGFNIKMLQAFLVLPAFYLLYLLAPPLPWWKRLIHLSLATVVLLAVSLVWVVAVDLTPSDRRPYVGSSQDNTVTELIIGHNGLSRLLPGGLRALTSTDDGASPPAGPQSGQPSASIPPGGPPGQPPLAPPGGRPARPQGAPPLPSGRPGQMPSPPAGGQPIAGRRSGGFSHETGEPGPLRLYSEQLGGQASWLLPLAGLGLLAAAWQMLPRLPLHRRHQSLLFWTVWLLPMIAFFSVANLFHRYYLEMLAPAIAALVGAGLVAMWKDYRQPGWRGWLLPLAMVIAGTGEAVILGDFPEWSLWLTPLVIGLTLLAAGGLVAARLLQRAGRLAWTGAIAAVGVLALLIAPAVWSLTPLWYGGDAGLPYAGPDLQDGARRGSTPDVDQLAAYLLANRESETYLAATINARTAAPIILATGEPVMAMGGFSGGDQILTVDELAQKVASGEVRFFLLSPQGNRQDGLTRWVAGQCAQVSNELWQLAPAGGPGRYGPSGTTRLYDCGAWRQMSAD